MKKIWYLLIAVCDFFVYSTAGGMMSQNWNGEIESKEILGEQYHAEYEEIYLSYQDWWSFVSVDTTESSLKKTIFVAKRPKKQYRETFFKDHSSYDDIALCDEEWTDDQAIKTLKSDLGYKEPWKNADGQLCIDPWKCISPLPWGDFECGCQEQKSNINRNSTLILRETGELNENKEEK